MTASVIAHLREESCSVSWCAGLSQNGGEHNSNHDGTTTRESHPLDSNTPIRYTHECVTIIMIVEVIHNSLLYGDRVLVPEVILVVFRDAEGIPFPEHGGEFSVAKPPDVSSQIDRE